MDGLREEVMLPIFMEMAILVMNTHFLQKLKRRPHPADKWSNHTARPNAQRYKHAGAPQNRWAGYLLSNE